MQFTGKAIFTKTFLIIVFMGLHILSDAQDTNFNTTTTMNSEELWYLQPWAWIAGGAIILLLLLALFRGNKKNTDNIRTDKIIITRTVKKESDVDE